MSPANKRDELLKTLTKRSENKPPMDVTYENKGNVLDQIITRSDNEQNSKSANQQTSANTNVQNSKSAEQQEFASANEQTSATAEPQTSADAKQQISKDADVQNSKSTKKQTGKTTKEQNGKKANLRRITFHIPDELFKQLKLISIEEDLTMLEIGAQMAEQYIQKKTKSRRG